MSSVSALLLTVHLGSCSPPVAPPEPCPAELEGLLLLLPRAPSPQLGTKPGKGPRAWLPAKGGAAKPFLEMPDSPDPGNQPDQKHFTRGRGDS